MTQDRHEGAAAAPGLEEGLTLLQEELSAARRWGAKSNRQLHRAVLADLRRAERRAAQAERRADRAERRAERAERRLAEIRSSATWRAGRAVLAVPSRIRRLRGR